MAKTLSEHQVFVSCLVFSPAWFLPLGLFLLLGHSFLLICCVIQPRFLAVFFGYFAAVRVCSMSHICYPHRVANKSPGKVFSLTCGGSLPVGRVPAINFPACPARKKERESKYLSTLISTSTRPYNAFLWGVLPLGTLRPFLILPS